MCYIHCQSCEKMCRILLQCKPIPRLANSAVYYHHLKHNQTHPVSNWALCCTLFKTIIVQFSRRTSMTVSRSRWVKRQGWSNPEQIWTGLSRGYSLKSVGVLNITPCPFKKLRGELRVLSELLVEAEVYWNPLRSTELSLVHPRLLILFYFALFCLMLLYCVPLCFIAFYLHCVI